VKKYDWEQKLKGLARKWREQSIHANMEAKEIELATYEKGTWRGEAMATKWCAQDLEDLLQ
jgi:hypothetical protein